MKNLIWLALLLAMCLVQSCKKIDQVEHETSKSSHQKTEIEQKFQKLLESNEVKRSLLGKLKNSSLIFENSSEILASKKNKAHVNFTGNIKLVSEDNILNVVGIDILFPEDGIDSENYQLELSVLEEFGRTISPKHNRLMPAILFVDSKGFAVESERLLDKLHTRKPTFKEGQKSGDLPATPNYIMPPDDDGGTESCSGTLYTVYQQDCTLSGSVTNCGPWYVVDQFFIGSCYSEGNNGAGGNASTQTKLPICGSSFNFKIETSDGSYRSTNLKGLKFVDPYNPNKVNTFDAYLGLANNVLSSNMNKDVYCPQLASSLTPLERLNDFRITKELMRDGEIFRTTLPNGEQVYKFSDYAHKVVSSFLANLAATNVVLELGPVASIPYNNVAADLFRGYYKELLKAFIPGSTCDSYLRSGKNSFVKYSTPQNPCQ
jgi:hypothetical protein